MHADKSYLIDVDLPRFCWRLPQLVASLSGRTSVCSWRTFLDLCLIRGWRVTTLWVRRPLWVNQLVQLSLPSLRVG